MSQSFTSAATSINKNRLPAIYNKIQFEQGEKVLDYGCGKYTEHIRKFMDGQGVYWLGFDPFNQTADHNINVLTTVNQLRLDRVILSNVLNVIDDTETILKVIRVAKNYLPKKGVFITVYEGDKSGIGKVTKFDCYQRNARKEWYVELLKDSGYTARMRNNVIIVK